ncbi:MAG: GWxTD domain-containing protein [Bacteroidetes bacterium]|nr:GWxTD domain-containing protein [Bacteroidota bacterium]
MKKAVLLILFISCILFGFSKPQNLRAYLSYSTFYSPEHGPYIETYLSVLGQSVIFVRNDNGKFQGSVKITMLFKQNDTIKDFRKYDLMSPEVDDTTTINFSFLDQQRIPLPNGAYDFELSISDKNRDKTPFTISENLSLSYPDRKLTVSGIELIESYKKASVDNPLTKSGYDFIPYMDNFFPASINKLTYYSEVYNSSASIQAGEKFGITVSIQSYETSKLITNYQRIKREDPKGVNVVFGEFDISQLPSGNYNLLISVRDKNNQELTSNSLFFQRSNPSIKYDMADISDVDLMSSFTSGIKNADSLREFIRCLFPISSGTEKLFIKTQLKTADLDLMRKYFHVFWTSRDNVNPVLAWNKYYEQVLAVEREFKATNKRGYETDRGRVYLQFGAPNARSQDTKDPSMYPYEIWQYYKIGNQTNRKFVFYTRDLAFNDYTLVHSDAEGEVYNPWWQRQVKRQSITTNDNNNYTHRPQDEEDNYFGGHSSDYYNLPR